MFFSQSSKAKLRRCSFTENSASGAGAAYIYGTSTPTFENCHFLQNKASGAEGGGGAAIVASSSLPVFQYCVFSQNTAAYGGVFSVNTQSGIVAHTQNTFSENSASRAGGVFYFMECTGVSISNAMFSKNRVSSSQGGGVLYSQTTCMPSRHYDAPTSLQSLFPFVLMFTPTQVTSCGVT